MQPVRKRIVVTGMGVISPNGIGTDAFARALAAGESGISNIDHIKADGLKSWAAGQVTDFEPAKVIDPAEARRVPRMVPMAIAASREAMGMAGLHLDDGDVQKQREIGVVLGTGGGGIAVDEDQYREYFLLGKGALCW